MCERTWVINSMCLKSECKSDSFLPLLFSKAKKLKMLWFPNETTSWRCVLCNATTRACAQTRYCECTYRKIPISLFIRKRRLGKCYSREAVLKSAIHQFSHKQTAFWDRSIQFSPEDEHSWIQRNTLRATKRKKKEKKNKNSDVTKLKNQSEHSFF